MKYISLTGHIGAMNHAVSRYLSRFDIQLEQSRHGLMQPFTTLNPYAQTLRKAEKFSAIVEMPPKMFIPLSSADAVNLVETAAAIFENRDARLRELETEISEISRQISMLEGYSSLDVDLFALEKSEFLHFRFGRFSAENYRRFEKFLRDDERIIFLAARKGREEINGVYFSPVSCKDEVDALFASLEFRVDGIVSCGFSATPAALLHFLREKVFSAEKEAAALAISTLDGICGAEKLAIACAKVKNLYAAFDVKKYAAISRGRRVFTFSGWICAEDADALEAEIETDDLILFTRHVLDDDARPPTLLKNLPVVRQFEFFTRLYGLPEYGEIDPTPVLAVTYTLLFGIMFGDIGHGAVLAFAGIFVQRRFHANLGGIMTIVGASAAVFGVLYGSVFGLEFSPPWRRPTTNISETLIFAAVLGAGLIVFSMCLNMYNAFRRGRIAELIFSPNGVAGLLFYSSVVWILVRVLVQGRGITVLVVMIAALPLILICFKLPFENFFAGRGFLPKKNVGAFLGHTAITLFETLLTYTTNTVSFVRVGAFAVSHVGMMHVVLQLARGAAAGGILVLIIGNALVLIIEGLLVGIQVLRLDYYEIFSRFYKGGGREFKSNFNRTEG